MGDMLRTSWPLVAMAAPPMVLHVILALGARRCSRWARIGSIFAGISLLFAFPIGTPFGVLILMSSLPRWSVTPADVAGA
ncbi:hypothetical protein [Paucibacter soli]|uniref:hypothetical protein n=1 Tax=Paucibacter soli TaxID=3133433 RepID=UPI003097D3BF